METDTNIKERIENEGKRVTITSEKRNHKENKSTLDEIEIALYCPEGGNHEEPMDLTFSQKQIKLDQMKNAINQEMNQEKQLIQSPQTDQLLYSANGPKKRGRKRKDNTIVEEKLVPNIKLVYRLPNYDNQDYLQTMDSRQAEVLMAAKSLFSKRTRTLYHWMYPNTPKAQLKSAVSMSWETLGVQEKEFYISQVLGRFGFPQSSLMVNPQLGGLRGMPTVPPLDLSSPSQLNLETRNAVSTILENPDEQNQTELRNSWPQCGLLQQQMKKINKKRRIGRPSGKVAKIKPPNNNRAVSVENINEEFQDDPELRKEFEQFKWALRMSDKKT